MSKLADALKNLSRHLDKLGSVGQSVRTKVDDFFAGLSNAPSGNIVNVQPQKALNQQNIDDAAANAAPGGSRLTEAWSGFKAGGAEYKPFAKGEIWSPHLDMGPDGGQSKFGYEVVKETAKLDDGAEQAENGQDQK